ncbi:hypothetical protein [Mesorhizobium sp. CN2-181]|uniref:hypothetical protein n=1 Tax=Mesorhizobium yinganensis TaxID=3157707 RepID=UPI0032B84F3E
MTFRTLLLFAVAISSGCSTTTAPSQAQLTSKSTNELCRALVTTNDQVYIQKVVALLVKRGANAEKCKRLIEGDNAVWAGIAVAGVGVAAGAVAANNPGYGGYYPNQPYGVAWDAFNNQYGQRVWRCRDRATGRFVSDYNCAGLPMTDYAWPGPII